MSRETSDGVDRLVLTGADGLYELDGDVFQYVGGSGSRLPQTLAAGPIEKTIAALTK
ncbi:hypothetical protein EV643_11910 [Kribbella sp. VKM Ac-2527]|uniref:Uncharacterized protein n=1 Tax=Kribbella caucasensis TaxID=2512215 RepID=A0A4R6K2M2_9ACTN|nr:hypothetical protein [Kribbella sp. VKM Ac-2527]TDO43077.1 hypothetical protein EV643_11910 [Kribbella sp. VKM Ac-2527]